MSYKKYETRESGVDWVVVGVIGSLVLIFGLIILTYRPQGQNKAPTVSDSLFTADEQSYDFGSISMSRGKVTKKFEIKNTAASSLTVTKISTSCMCTTATLIRGEERFGPFSMVTHSLAGDLSSGLDQIFQLGDGAGVEIVFDPAAHGPSGIGPIARQTYIDTSDGKRLILDFKAMVTP